MEETLASTNEVMSYKSQHICCAIRPVFIALYFDKTSKLKKSSKPFFFFFLENLSMNQKEIKDTVNVLKFPTLYALLFFV